MRKSGPSSQSQSALSSVSAWYLLRSEASWSSLCLRSLMSCATPASRTTSPCSSTSGVPTQRTQTTLLPSFT